MKLEPDISGVCRITGTREMITCPAIAASTKMKATANPSAMRRAPVRVAAIITIGESGARPVNHRGRAAFPSPAGAVPAQRRVVMKHRTALSSLALLLLGLALAGTAAAADRGDRVEHRMDRRGDRIDHRLDRRGARIEQRYDQRARWADAHGHERMADRLEHRGNRIEQRLDRRGDLADARWDRRGERFDRRWDRHH
ncbi:hypothetical protein LYSHEL_05450 [Lysobacter helvus]|uniref:Uncharacterized protein n=1 Tax=Lysobacter helvus TaxID=2675059 RepID=A0ABM7QB13_9GAMM|nr:hypothetical protein LYSHEL_05450 [Lysobacter helvus]